MKALDIIAGAAFLIAIVALPFFVWNWSSFLGRRNRMPIKSILFFAIPILIALAASETSTGIGHDEVLRKLNSLKENCRVSINGKAAPNSQEIVSVPKTIDSLPAHHSSPTKRINIDITDHAPRLVLSLARDSGDPREYWVF
jgi:hypothetical protein